MYVQNVQILSYVELISNGKKYTETFSYDASQILQPIAPMTQNINNKNTHLHVNKIQWNHSTIRS